MIELNEKQIKEIKAARNLGRTNAQIIYDLAQGYPKDSVLLEMEQKDLIRALEYGYVLKEEKCDCGCEEIEELMREVNELIFNIINFHDCRK